MQVESFADYGELRKQEPDYVVVSYFTAEYCETMGNMERALGRHAVA